MKMFLRLLMTSAFIALVLGINIKLNTASFRPKEKHNDFSLWVNEHKEQAFNWFFNKDKRINSYQNEMAKKYKEKTEEVKKIIKEWFLDKLKTHFTVAEAIGTGATLINNANKLNNE